MRLMFTRDSSHTYKYDSSVSKVLLHCSLEYSASTTGFSDHNMMSALLVYILDNLINSTLSSYFLNQKRKVIFKLLANIMVCLFYANGLSVLQNPNI